jgi:hypothetical protein
MGDHLLQCDVRCPVANEDFEVEAMTHGRGGGKQAVRKAYMVVCEQIPQDQQ